MGNDQIALASHLIILSYFSPMAEEPTVKFENLSDPDSLKKHKTVYDVSYKELVWRNFVAGMSRALGIVFIQFLFFAVMAGITAQLLLPQITKLFGGYFNTINSMQRGGTTQSPIDFNTLQQLIP